MLLILLIFYTHILTQDEEIDTVGIHCGFSHERKANGYGKLEQGHFRMQVGQHYFPNPGFSMDPISRGFTHEQWKKERVVGSNHMHGAREVEGTLGFFFREKGRWERRDGISSRYICS